MRRSEEQFGLLVNAVRPNSLRFAPPLVVSPGEIEQALELLGPCS